MGYKSWQIAKWNKEKANKASPYKQMKDRDMHNVEVLFKKGSQDSYYFKEINQLSNKVSMTYIANLSGRKGLSRYWTHHGGGGYVSYLTLKETEFEKMKTEVERLGGRVTLQWLKQLINN